MIKKYNSWLKNNLNEKINFLTDYNEIENFLYKYHYDYKNYIIRYNINDYLIREDGTVDVDGDVNLRELTFDYFPIKFGVIKGDFTCSYCYKLKSLEGAPKECRNFYCNYCNSLKNLKGAPEECEDFNCNHCENLKTLEGAPEECEYFDCSWCYSLEFFGESLKKCNYFDCYKCHNLDYSFDHFPKCKSVNVDETFFEKLYYVLGDDNFMKLINAKTDFKYESILMIAYLSGELEFEDDIKHLLRNDIATEEAFKHKYRGVVAGERFRF